MSERSVLGSSAVMAAGTMVSRFSGYFRSILLAAALGNALHADVFSIANTVPNMLYILLAGGVFNAVLVPQLVRAGKNDPDGGEAYTNRIVTLAALFLGAVTVLLVLAAPLVMRLYLDGTFYAPELAAQRESVVDFARFCLPQVFFYGMYVLVGQILNARGSFGPMMWAPIANNVIAIAVLVTYLLSFGPAEDLCGGFTGNQELLLGLGSTAGIAAQFLILVPYLRKAGFRFSPRFDFRGTGLGHTARLAIWTLLFVVVNQIAYLVVVRLASSGTATSALGTCGTGDDQGTGYTIYSSAFLLIMAPHSIVTVSLATAILPRLSARAAEGDYTGLAAALSATLRTALALVVPVVLFLPLMASEIADVVWGYGASAETFESFAPTLAAFSLGLFFFTCHYLVLRGFYALEQNRAVFWIQCVIAATNIVAAVVLVGQASPEDTAPALVAAYTISYAVGSVLSYVLLARQLGGLRTRTLLRFAVRTVLAAAAAAGVAYLCARMLRLAADQVPAGDSKIGTLLVVGLVFGAFAVTYVGLARAMRIREVTGLVDSVMARLPGRR